MRFPLFSVPLHGTLCSFSQISLQKIWRYQKHCLSLQPCRIRSNAEVRLPNVTHRQRHEVGRFPNGKSHLFFVSLFSHNSHSNFCDNHFDKKDTFADLGKSSQNEQFVFLWGIVPPFARNPHTSILCITSKSIKNESTTANPTLNFSRSSSKCSQPCRSEQRKKTSVIA